MKNRWKGIIEREVEITELEEKKEELGDKKPKKGDASWEDFQKIPRDRDKRRYLVDKGVILLVKRKARPVRPSSIPYRFFHRAPTRLPEEDIYAEIVRLYPEAAMNEDEEARA